MKKLSLLGSTGSIGTQALQVVQNLREQGEKWEVAALAARSSVNRLEEQARKFHPDVVAVFDEGAALSLRQSLRDTDIQVLSGMEVVDAICQVKTDRNDRPETEQKMKSVRVDTKGETYPEPKKLKDPYGRF